MKYQLLTIVAITLTACGGSDLKCAQDSRPIQQPENAIVLYQDSPESPVEVLVVSEAARQKGISTDSILKSHDKLYCCGQCAHEAVKSN